MLDKWEIEANGLRAYIENTISVTIRSEAMTMCSIDEIAVEVMINLFVFGIMIRVKKLRVLCMTIGWDQSHIHQMELILFLEVRINLFVFGILIRV